MSFWEAYFLILMLGGFCFLPLVILATFVTDSPIAPLVVLVAILVVFYFAADVKCKEWGCTDMPKVEAIK